MSQARRAARKPSVRTVELHGTGELAEWVARARVDFPAQWLVELQSHDFGKVLAVLDRVLVEHNFPDADGNVAATMADVDPFTGLLEIVDRLGDVLKTLPPR